MSQVFEDLSCVFESVGSSSFYSQSPRLPVSRTTTPNQGDYDKGVLRLSDGTKEEIGSQRHYLSANTGQLLNQPRVDIEAGWEREQQKHREREADQDKFSTLFEPSTPRASPTLMSESLPKVNHPASLVSLFDQSHFTPAGYRASRPASISKTTSSDFGTFVEVTASEDPLSSVLGNDGTMTPLLPVEPNLSTGGGIDTSTRAFSHVQHSNTTLDFFGMFTQNAKQRSIAARSQLLDELLLHEDDPMWFTLEDRHEEENINPSSIPASPAPPAQVPVTSILNDSAKQDKEKPLISLMQEIDYEYFRPPPSLSPSRSRSSSPTLHRRISSSNSISPLPPAIAPPIACQLTAPLAIGRSHSGEYQDFVDTPGIEPPKQSLKDSSLEMPSSDPSSISSLSSKLMLSLLRSGQDPPSHTSRSVDPHGSTSEHDETASTFVPPRPSYTTFPSSKPMSKVPRITTHAETLPIATLATTEKRHIQPVFKRINLSSVTHTTSPFAATFYTPPSGAPGFEGDRYDWDKGFSDELENVSSSVKDTYGRRDGEGIGVSASTSGSRSTSRLSASRGWGTGFGFGFGSVRGQPPGRRSRSPLPMPESRQIGPDPADLQDSNRGPLSKSSIEFGSLGRMGEVIERKIGNVELVGRKASSTPVLMPELASMLRAHLPALSRLPRSWTLIYSLDQHGISLNTLYSRCESHLTRKPEPGEFGVSKGMLLAMKDAGAGDGDDEHRALFGAWIAEGLRMNKGKGYSGGGESFLWKYIDGVLKVFKTTGRNNYVALCEPEYISFGGGDGHYGLYLDESLLDGSSAPCPTFDNEPLCTGSVVGNLKTVKFECVGLEVWGMS